MDEPKRIQRRRAPGWRMPAGAVYVGRGSRWGNSFVVCDFSGVWMVGKIDPKAMFGLPETFIGSWPSEREATAEAVRCYVATMREADKEIARRTLRGKTLACWCAVSDPCHGDALLQIANAPLRCEAASGGGAAGPSAATVAPEPPV